MVAWQLPRVCEILWGAKQRIEDRILAKPYDKIITLIESYNESPKPESRKLKPKDIGSDTKSINVKLEIRLNEHWLRKIMFVFVEFKFAFF